MGDRQAAALFRAHLETLVRSTSAGALCDTDEEALLALEETFRTSKNRQTYTDEDVDDYLQSQWLNLEDGLANDDADQEDQHTPEPEVLQWLRQYAHIVDTLLLATFSCHIPTEQYLQVRTSTR